MKQSLAAIRAVRDRAEALCARLADRPIHAVLHSEVPWVKMHRWTRGLTAPWMHAVLRDDIGERWREDGGTILLNQRTLMKGWGGESLDDFEHEFRICCVHETMHVVQMGRMSRVLDPIEFGLATAALKEGPLHPRRFENIEDMTPPWVGHGLDFVRLSIHAAFRCRQLGFDVPVQRLVPSEVYSLSRADMAYRPALGNEPEELSGLPLSEILTVPVPVAFREQFERDAALWVEEMCQLRAECAA